jgi:NADH-quinone oxidoreductase subunit G
LWTRGSDVLRVTARKNEYGEVVDFICNECRFEKKEMGDWVIDGPRHIPRASVISANHYELPVLNPQVISDMPQSTIEELNKYERPFQI